MDLAGRYAAYNNQSNYVMQLTVCYISGLDIIKTHYNFVHMHIKLIDGLLTNGRLSALCDNPFFLPLLSSYLSFPQCQARFWDNSYNCLEMTFNLTAT